MPNPEKTMENCILMLQHIQEDSSIPRNIRRVADETRTLLTNNSKAMGLRAAEAISKIDEISNDPNMPIHARTRIWSSYRSWRRFRWTDTSRLNFLILSWTGAFLPGERHRYPDVMAPPPFHPSSLCFAGQKLQME